MYVYYRAKLCQSVCIQHKMYVCMYVWVCMSYLSCYVMFCSSIHAKGVYDMMYDMMWCILYDD